MNKSPAIVCLLVGAIVVGPTAAPASTTAQEAKLLPADGEAGDQFGLSVALDGDTAIIGAWLDDDSGSNSGSAYVFRPIPDPAVPATNVVGTVLLLLAMLGTGACFVRRLRVCPRSPLDTESVTRIDSRADLGNGS